MDILKHVDGLDFFVLLLFVLLETGCILMNNKSWEPISSAPKDGTMILVTETPNGEHWNVVVACWMAHKAEDIIPNEHLGDWWGIDVARWRDTEGPLPVRWKPLAISPVCWMPFPDHEPISKLNRRMAALYRNIK
jgi:hypothetical protein